LSICQDPLAKEVSEYLARYKEQRIQNLVEGATWTLIHDYSEHKHMEEVLKQVQNFFEALAAYEKGDSSALSQFGGVKGFKEKLAHWLDDDDQAIRAYSVVMLGIFGDHEYADELAGLLKPRKYKSNDLIHYDRGRAAMALGLVGAKEYTAKLANLLKSSNQYDRSGAAYGLAFLGAKDQARAIAKLIDDGNEGVREASRESLEMLGATGLIKTTRVKKL
jgi:HEAT repeat protein